MAAFKHWSWFVGALAWYVDAAIQLHYHARGRALLALAVATVFFVAGMFWVRTPRQR